jgi:hypothetical protein
LTSFIDSHGSNRTIDHVAHRDFDRPQCFHHVEDLFQVIDQSGNLLIGKLKTSQACRLANECFIDDRSPATICRI